MAKPTNIQQKTTILFIPHGIETNTLLYLVYNFLHETKKN